MSIFTQLLHTYMYIIELIRYIVQLGIWRKGKKHLPTIRVKRELAGFEYER